MLKDVREPDAPAIHEAPPPGRPAAIRTVRLAKEFGDTKALKELDLEVPRGIVFGLLGEVPRSSASTARPTASRSGTGAATCRAT